MWHEKSAKLIFPYSADVPPPPPCPHWALRVLSSYCWQRFHNWMKNASQHHKEPRKDARSSPAPLYSCPRRSLIIDCLAAGFLPAVTEYSFWLACSWPEETDVPPALTFTVLLRFSWFYCAPLQNPAISSCVRCFSMGAMWCHAMWLAWPSFVEGSWQSQSHYN